MSNGTTDELTYATEAPSRYSAEEDYHALNAKLNILDENGEIQLDADKDAIKQFMTQHVDRNMVYFDSLEEKLAYLVENNYYEGEILDQYDKAFIKSLFKAAYAYNYKFETFMGAFKSYSSYMLKTFDGKRYLERFQDRVVMNALYLGAGDEALARNVMDEMMSGRYQPATPTFLNAGKKQRGEMVSCFLLRTEDNMESISRNITNALQLSKRGGGVALNLSNLREHGAPIKNIENQASGVVPVMKMLEDAFSYANQLGARQGAGAVYLNVHHPDIHRFLDTKRENADEKIRIKTLSLGVVIPDITYQLAKRNEPMYTFSPYDVEKVYGIPFCDLDVTEKYYEMVDDKRIRKQKINVRELFTTIAEIQFESGYPYILNVDTANRSNPIHGRISMSNLCSEILQVSEPSTYNGDGTYKVVGKDISCNLGSLNVAKTFDSPDFAKTIETSIRALTNVSDLSDISSVPSIEAGNKRSHAIGLGQMNLHGFLAREHIQYDSPEAVDFTNVYFYSVLFQVLKASNKIAKEKGETFDNFEKSKYATGEFFDQFFGDEDHGAIKTDKVRDLMDRTSIIIPTREDWAELKESIMKYGIYNQNLQAVPPTGSISYINNSTSSIHPIASQIETRKEGKLGRVYYPAPYLSKDTMPYYRSSYQMDTKAVIDVYAAATKWVDQGLSLTLMYNEGVTTRDINRNMIYAFSKGVKTLYYIRMKPKAVAGTEVGTAAEAVADFCESCAL